MTSTDELERLRGVDGKEEEEGVRLILQRREGKWLLLFILSKGRKRRHSARLKETTPPHNAFSLGSSSRNSAMWSKELSVSFPIYLQSVYPSIFSLPMHACRCSCLCDVPYPESGV